MPTGDTQQTLYFSTDNGETFEPLGHITDTPELVPDGDDEGKTLSLISGGELTFTAQANVHKNVLRLILGLDWLVPNNWLKMHHLPMRRGKRLKIYGLRMKRRRK